jgi:hypothetical protein
MHNLCQLCIVSDNYFRNNIKKSIMLTLDTMTMVLVNLLYCWLKALDKSVSVINARQRPSNAQGLQAYLRPDRTLGLEDHKRPSSA